MPLVTLGVLRLSLAMTRYEKNSTILIPRQDSAQPCHFRDLEAPRTIEQRLKPYCGEIRLVQGNLCDVGHFAGQDLEVERGAVSAWNAGACLVLYILMLPV